MTERQTTRLAFWGLLACAAAVRLWVMLSYHSAVLSPAVHDAAAYINAAHYGLGEVSHEPSGYPLFLRIVHEFGHSLAFTILVQHGLGLATGVLLYLAVRRLGAPAWLGLIPAIFVWFNGDQLFLEHAPMSEALFEFIVAAMVYASIRSLEGGLAWPALAGALAGVAITIRSVAVLLPLLLMSWLIVGLMRSGVRWRKPAAAMLAASLAVVGIYGAVKVGATGQVSSILADGAGWNLYARVAPFAECGRFRPPAGARRLCQSTPPAQRQGPSYYLWKGGPARAAFGGPPSHDGLLRSFADAVIEHQPLDYLSALGTGLLGYVDRSLGPQWSSDFDGVEALNFIQHGTMLDPAVVRQVQSYYGPVPEPSHAGALALQRYQRVVRVTGTMLLMLLILALAALIPGRSVPSRGVVLLMAVAIYLLVMPVVVLDTQWRYVIPVLGPLGAAAAIGAWKLCALARRVLPVVRSGRWLPPSVRVR